MRALAAIVCLVAFAAAACSDEEGDRLQNATGTPETTTTTAGGGVVEPPSAFLVDSSGTPVEGGTGTYCWRLGDEGVCIDLFGPRTNADPIAIDAGTQLEFEFDAGTPTSAQADWTPAAELESSQGEGGTLNWVPADSTNYQGPSYVDELTAPSEPGRYVLTVFTFFPEGDVSYGFYVEVA